MANIISRIAVSLGLDNSKFKKGIKDSEKQTKSFGNTIQKIGGMIAGAFAVGKITSFFKESFKLYGIQERAERSLAAAIEMNGKAVSSTLDDYKRYASGLQAITTIGDETTLQLLQLAEAMGAAVPKEAVTQAVGLSKALNIDLRTALRGVILAGEGEFTMLQRYIPALRTANTETEKRAALEKAAATGMRIATEEAKTQTGQIEQLGNAWGDLREGIGKFLSDGGEATGITAKLTEEITDMGNVLKNDTIPTWLRLTALFSKPLADKLANITDLQNDYAETSAQRNKDIINGLQLQGKSLETLRFMYQEIKNSADEAFKKVALPAIYKTIAAQQEQSEATKEEVRNIETLQAKVKELEQTKLTATGSSLVNTNRRIAALQQEIKTLQTLGLEYLKPFEMPEAKPFEALKAPELDFTLAKTGNKELTEILNQANDSTEQLTQTMGTYGNILSSVGTAASNMGSQTAASFLGMTPPTASRGTSLKDVLE